jgi:hypothetical protein
MASQKKKLVRISRKDLNIFMMMIFKLFYFNGPGPFGNTVFVEGFDGKIINPVLIHNLK